jgi:hypothetical protein
MVSQTARSRARPTKTPIPGYKKYSATLGPVNEYDVDVWICENNLHAAEELVRIPSEYGNAASEGRAIFVYNHPSNFLNQSFKALFSLYKVEAIPILIDTVSQEVFRWAIFGTFEEAQDAIQTIDGWIIEKHRVRVCQAMTPGKSFREIFSYFYCSKSCGYFSPRP